MSFSRLPKFQVTVTSPRSGIVSHVLRAVDAEAAALRVLSSYPAEAVLSKVEQIERDEE
ncbi:hypothetical protein [Paracoccus aestuariivivens]|uniref:Uncharacterized protein n=1 Tax=Paracoccus aestuariivivens TaxID=1820333 RepID=A0A6L6J8J5_9RHOB|nr:hypothetical protein [Paracoccus aestuariivivens]MTH76331.1 hypothetical protein [Paracoccus aestuariivivens]